MTMARTIADRQRGFTLIEVLVGIGLTAILVLGMTALWATVATEFMRLTLRQQAVYALNGEMARLAMLFRVGVHSATPTTPQFDDPTTPGTTETDNFNIFPNDYTPGANYAVTGSLSGATNFIEDTEGNFTAGEVFYYDAGNGVTGDDRNLIWLDTDRDIVASVFWEQTAMTNTAVGAVDSCFTVPCFQVTLYLDYPYRFRNGTLTEMEPIRRISVQTILAQKRAS